jgi:hypothetical protein
LACPRIVRLSKEHYFSSFRYKFVLENFAFRVSTLTLQNPIFFAAKGFICLEKLSSQGNCLHAVEFFFLPLVIYKPAKFRNIVPIGPGVQL